MMLGRRVDSAQPTGTECVQSGDRGVIHGRLDVFLTGLGGMALRRRVLDKNYIHGD